MSRTSLLDIQVGGVHAEGETAQSQIHWRRPYHLHAWRLIFNNLVHARACLFHECRISLVAVGMPAPMQAISSQRSIDHGYMPDSRSSRLERLLVK